MGRFLPGEEADEMILENEDDTDPTIDNVSIGSHSNICCGVPYLALKRRKFVVISGRLKPGRLRYFKALLSTSKTASSSSCPGMTCCRSLLRRLARHFL